MKHLIVPIITYLERFALAALLALLLHKPALATGTNAGIDISNTASVDYAISGTSSTTTSNTVTFRVDEKLDVNVSWQDAVAYSRWLSEQTGIPVITLPATVDYQGGQTLSLWFEIVIQQLVSVK